MHIRLKLMAGSLAAFVVGASPALAQDALAQDAAGLLQAVQAEYEKELNR